MIHEPKEIYTVGINMEPCQMEKIVREVLFIMLLKFIIDRQSPSPGEVVTDTEN